MKILPNRSAGGIYCLTLKADNRVYIGQTRQQFQKRWWNHSSELNKGTHGNVYLQRAWDKYGQESFEFSVLEKVACIDQLNEAELRWINWFCSYDPSRGFNLLTPPDGMSTVTSDEYRKICSDRARRELEDPDRFASLQQASQDYWNKDENRLRQSEITKKRLESPRARATISAAVKAAWTKPEYRQAGIRTAEMLWKNEEYRAKQMQVRRSAATIERKSAAAAQASAKKRGWVYGLTSPDGEKHVVYNLAAFCKEHGLVRERFAHAFRQERVEVDGWGLSRVILTDEALKQYGLM